MVVRLAIINSYAALVSLIFSYDICRKDHKVEEDVRGGAIFAKYKPFMA